jgi:hypothetical protein
MDSFGQKYSKLYAAVKKCHSNCLYEKTGWLKVSKSKKKKTLKLHCPKNEQNIRQNSAL